MSVYCTRGEALQVATLGADQQGAWEVLTPQQQARLDRLIEAASRQVDADCGRRFGPAPADVEDRIRYPLLRSRVLQLDDHLVVTAVAEEGQALSSSDWYSPQPANGRPLRQLYRAAGAWGHGPIAVTARWGWAETPPAITTATLLLVRAWYATEVLRPGSDLTTRPMEYRHIIESWAVPSIR